MIRLPLRMQNIMLLSRLPSISSRPNDPHAGMLRDVSLQGIAPPQCQQGKTRVVEAEEITMIDIDLPNENGKM